MRNAKGGLLIWIYFDVKRRLYLTWSQHFWNVCHKHPDAFKAARAISQSNKIVRRKSYLCEGNKSRFRWSFRSNMCDNNLYITATGCF